MSAGSFGRWSCHACTFSNVSAALHCEVCSASRIAGVQATAQPASQAQQQRFASVGQQGPEARLGADQAAANFALPSSATSTPSQPTRNHSVGAAPAASQNQHQHQQQQQGWTCGACSLVNVASVGRCDACDSVRPAVLGASGASQQHASSIIMPVLASARGTPRHSNTPPPPPAQQNSARRSGSATPVLAPGQFQCQSCTFVSSGSACELCGAARSGAAALTGSEQAASTWHCLVCSLLNPIDSVRCSACRAVSPLAPRAAEPAGPTVPMASRPRTARGQVLPVLARQASEHRSERNPQVGGSSGLVAPRTASVGIKLPSSSAGSAANDAMLDPTGEREAAQQWQEIMAVCGASGSAFVDDSFRPGDRAIYGPHKNHFADLFAAYTAADGTVQPARQRGPYAWKRGRSATKESSAAWCVLPFGPDGSIDVRPQDIKQGELGDCWFLSALSVLAERPRLIEHLLLTPELNDVGAYQVRFCKDGRWVVVTVDDYLPVSPATGRLAFSHTPSNELWVALVEKAYAKLHGSYAAIESGSISDAFAELTGAPSERLHLHLEDASRFEASQMLQHAHGDPSQYNDLLWATILSFRQSKFLMGASCGRKAAKPGDYAAVGLRENHAYCLLDAHSSNGVQLLCLRNPWGSESWTGAWSAGSKEWTPEWKARLNYPQQQQQQQQQHAPNASGFVASLYQALGASSSSGGKHTNNSSSSGGVFWITFSDFLRYFRTLDVCKYQDDWHVMRLRDEFPLIAPPQPPPAQSSFGQHLLSNAAASAAAAAAVPLAQQATPWTSTYMYELSIPQSTWCFISLIQADLRGTSAPLPHAYRSMGLYLLKSKTAQPVESHLSAYHRCNEAYPETQRVVTCETLLTEAQGRYLLLPCSYAATIQAASGMVLPSAAGGSAGAGSAQSFPFILCVYSAHPVLIKRRPAYLPALTIATHLSCLRGESKPLSESATLYTFSCQGGLWFVVVNRHATKYLSITLDCSRSTGLVPSRGPHLGPQALKTKDFVPPKHRQLLLALVTPRGDSGYTYERACTYIHLDGVAGQLHTPPLRRGYDIHIPVHTDCAFVGIVT